MNEILFKAFELLLSLSLLVFIHELGHFMWARIFHVKVEKFYLFFDTPNFALLRWKPKGSDTEYGIGWIPLGGYCAISGMVDETHDAKDLSAEMQPWEFRAKGAFARFMIMFGGVLNNLILACLIYIGMTWCWGKDVVETRTIADGMVYNEYAQQLGFRNGDILWSIDGKSPSYSGFRNDLLLATTAQVKRGDQIIDIELPSDFGQQFLKDETRLHTFAEVRHPLVMTYVGEGTPAKAAGFQPGDSVVMVDGKPVRFLDEVKACIAAAGGDTLLFGFYRAGVDTMLTAPIVVGEDGLMGVTTNPLTSLHFTHYDYNFFTAIPEGINRGWTSLYNYVRQFKLVFSKEGAKQVGGFAAMGNIFPTSWNWIAFWGITAFISVALAFMNILPIPGLDGGHIMILIIEVIIRRPISDRAKEIAQYIGFGLVILLMVLANGNDLYRFIIKPFIG